MIIKKIHQKSTSQKTSLSRSPASSPPTAMSLQQTSGESPLVLTGDVHSCTIYTGQRAMNFSASVSQQSIPQPPSSLGDILQNSFLIVMFFIFDEFFPDYVLFSICVHIWVNIITIYNFVLEISLRFRLGSQSYFTYCTGYYLVLKMQRLYGIRIIQNKSNFRKLSYYKALAQKFDSKECN